MTSFSDPIHSMKSILLDLGSLLCSSVGILENVAALLSCLNKFPNVPVLKRNELSAFWLPTLCDGGVGGPPPPLPVPDGGIDANVTV